MCNLLTTFTLFKQSFTKLAFSPTNPLMKSMLLLFFNFLWPFNKICVFFVVFFFSGLFEIRFFFQRSSNKIPIFRESRIGESVDFYQRTFDRIVFSATICRNPQYFLCRNFLEPNDFNVRKIGNKITLVIFRVKINFYR